MQNEPRYPNVEKSRLALAPLSGINNDPLARRHGTQSRDENLAEENHARESRRNAPEWNQKNHRRHVDEFIRHRIKELAHRAHLTVLARVITVAEIRNPRERKKKHRPKTEPKIGARRHTADPTQ